MYQIRLATQVFLKLLLAFTAVIGAVQIFRLMLLPGLQSLFHPSDSVTSVLRRIGIFIFAVLAHWAYVRFFEKRNASELRPAPLATVLGAASGCLLIAFPMLLLYAAGVYRITANPDMQTGLLGVSGVILIAAFLEELTYRCILFRILENAWGTIPALGLQSVIFAIAHVANLEDKADMQELITMILSVTLLGALWTLVFVHTRNLWVATANHAAWNFTIILSGLPLSGVEDWRRMAPFVGEYRGPAWLSGGLFGPETSIVTIVIVAVSLAALLYWARRENRFVRGMARGNDSNVLPKEQRSEPTSAFN